MVFSVLFENGDSNFASVYEREPIRFVAFVALITIICAVMTRLHTNVILPQHIAHSQSSSTSLLPDLLKRRVGF